MKTCRNTIISVVAVAIMIVSCTGHDSIVMDTIYNNNVRFNIYEGSNPETKSQTVSYSESNSICSVEAIQNTVPETSTAFGIIGYGKESGNLLIANQAVYNKGGVRTAVLTVDAGHDDNLLISAYYPYSGCITYNQGGKYSVYFSSDDLQMGPMVDDSSLGCRQLEGDVNLSFSSIYSSLGFGVYDNTRDEQLQGLMHVRKVILHGMQVEGTYIYNGKDSHWVPQIRNKSMVVYDGCDSVLTGAGNTLYLSASSVSDNLGECKRMNVIPEVLSNSIQSVEVIYDVDPFEYNGTHYNGMNGASQTVGLSELIPGNVLKQGYQYTCTLGLDLGLIYRTIEFSASVADWNNVNM